MGAVTRNSCLRSGLTALLLMATSWSALAGETPVEAGKKVTESVPSVGSTAIAGMQHLSSGGIQAVQPSDGGPLFFMSDNGRFVFRGELWDVWAKKRIATLDEVRDASARLDLAGLKLNWPELKPLVLGKGAKTVRIFVDPNCPYCHQLLARLDTFAAQYRFELYVVPLLGQDSAHKARLLACARSETEASAALVRHDGYDELAQTENCDLGAAQRRLVTAKLLGIEGVPWLIASDGRTHQGLPDDLGAFLTGTVAP